MEKKEFKSYWTAKNEIYDFVKSLIGKEVTKYKLSKFREVLVSCDDNFKTSTDVSIQKHRYDEFLNKERALKCLKTGVMNINNWDWHFKITEITAFGSYQHDIYRATIGGKEYEISESDYKVIKYLHE